MKTPEEILSEHATHRAPNGEEYWGKRDIIKAMKEFGRQVWLKCASGFEEARPPGRESDFYDDYLQDLYFNQIAKESQERGEYKEIKHSGDALRQIPGWDDSFKNEFGDFLKDEPKPEKCKHKKSYFFHDNAPRYCPDCEKYIDGENES